jgi:hypothetical protein
MNHKNLILLIMKQKSIIAVLLLTLFSVFTIPVLAQVKTQPTPSVLTQTKKTTAVVTPTPTVMLAAKLPTFVVGQNNTISNPIVGDLMVAGGQNKISTTVNGDTYIAGGQIDVGGNITGNLIVAGGTVTISGNINKNLIVAGGQVMLDNLSTVNGYVLVAGGKVDLQGKVLGSVKIGASNLSMGEAATIGGNLEADVAQSNISSNAKISGTKTVNIHETKRSETQVTQKKNMNVVSGIYGFLSKLVVLLVLVKLFSRTARFKNLQLDSFWSELGWGLIILIVAPFLSLILMITVVGIPLSLLMIALYLVLLYLSSIVVSIAIGKMITDKKILKIDNVYLQGIVGLLLLTLIKLIPFIGGLVSMVVVILGLGILYKQFCQK